MFLTRTARRILLPILLAAGLLASGCLSVPQEPESSGEAPDATDAPSTEAGPKGWAVGDAWRYAVTGSHMREGGTMTIGVVEADPGSYLLGTDHSGFHEASVTGTVAPWAGRVDAQTLAPYVDGRPRDLIGIDREPSESWQVHYAGSTFSFVRSEAMFIDGAPGHRAAGTAPDGTSIVVEYNEEAGWFTRFMMRDKDDRVLVGLRLLERLDEAPNMLETWNVLSRHKAMGYDGRMGLESFHSDGSADLVLVKVQVHDDAVVKRSSSSTSSDGLVGGLVDRARDLLGGLTGTTSHSSSTSLAGVSVLGPGEERIVALRGLGPGEEVRMVRDQAGPWQLVASTGGPSVELVVYRVEVIHHIL